MAVCDKFSALPQAASRGSCWHLEAIKIVFIKIFSFYFLIPILFWSRLKYYSNTEPHLFIYLFVKQMLAIFHSCLSFQLFNQWHSTHQHLERWSCWYNKVWQKYGTFTTSLIVWLLVSHGSSDLDAAHLRSHSQPKLISDKLPDSVWTVCLCFPLAMFGNH